MQTTPTAVTRRGAIVAAALFGLLTLAGAWLLWDNLSSPGTANARSGSILELGQDASGGLVDSAGNRFVLVEQQGQAERRLRILVAEDGERLVLEEREVGPFGDRKTAEFVRGTDTQVELRGNGNTRGLPG